MSLELSPEEYKDLVINVAIKISPVLIEKNQIV